MSNLVLAIVSIVLTLLLTLASVFYGGDIVSKSRLDAGAVAMVNQAQQIHGAALLYREDAGEWPANTAVLVVGGYLNSMMSPPSQTYAMSSIVTSAYANNDSLRLNEAQFQERLDYFVDEGVLDQTAANKVAMSKMSEKQRFDFVQLMGVANERRLQVNGPSELDWSWVSQARPYIWLPGKLSEAACTTVNKHAGVHSDGIPVMPDPNVPYQCFGEEGVYTFLYLPRDSDNDATLVCAALSDAGVGCSDTPPPIGPPHACYLFDIWRDPSDPAPTPEVVQLDGTTRWGDPFNKMIAPPSVYDDNGDISYDWSTTTFEIGGVPLTTVSPENNWWWGDVYRITALPPMPAGTHEVKMRLSSGQYCVGQVTYVAEFFTVSSVSPDPVSYLGGQLMTVSGSGFGPGLSIRVQLPNGDEVSVPVTVEDGQTATFVAPASVQLGWASVEVTSANGDSEWGGYNYESPTPLTLDSVAPNQVYFGGGTAVALTGSNFDPSDRIYDDRGTPLTVLSSTPTEVIAIVPSRPMWGAGYIHIENALGEYAGIGVITEPMQLLNCNPCSGAKAGFTTQLTGRHFHNAMTVTVGGVSVPFTVESDTAISIAVPASNTPGLSHSAGSVMVAVTRDGVQRTLNLTYSDALRINTLIPFEGSWEGGYPVVLQGVNIPESVSVTVDGNPVTAVRNSGTQITITSMPAITNPYPNGSVYKPITVTGEGESVTRQFGYLANYAGEFFVLSIGGANKLEFGGLFKSCPTDSVPNVDNGSNAGYTNNPYVFPGSNFTVSMDVGGHISPVTPWRMNRAGMLNLVNGPVKLCMGIRQYFAVNAVRQFSWGTMQVLNTSALPFTPQHADAQGTVTGTTTAIQLSVIIPNGQTRTRQFAVLDYVVAVPAQTQDTGVVAIMGPEESQLVNVYAETASRKVAFIENDRGTSTVLPDRRLVVSQSTSHRRLWNGVEYTLYGNSANNWRVVHGMPADAVSGTTHDTHHITFVPSCSGSSGSAETFYPPSYTPSGWVHSDGGYSECVIDLLYSPPGLYLRGGVEGSGTDRDLVRTGTDLTIALTNQVLTSFPATNVVAGTTN